MAGDFVGAGISAIGTGLDVAAAVVPGVPGGVSLLAKSTNLAMDMAEQTAKAADEITAGVTKTVAETGQKNVQDAYKAKWGDGAGADKSVNRGNGGRGGGPEHASVQENISDTAGGRQEVSIEGSGRIADNVDGQGRIHQIGDMRSRGGEFRPSARERGAIEDIREAVGPDTDIFFHDKRGQGPTLINPDQQPDWRPAPEKHRKR